jgi:tetratricopeptide (TPR) repeat protein
MKTIRTLIASFSVLLLVAAPGRAAAQEAPQRFLDALRENGYGDMAVEYLKLLEKRPDLPADLRDVWDLEMSKALRAAASDAFDAKEYEQLMDESEKALARFIKEKPDHPEAVTAMAAWGDFLVKRALESIRAAKALEGKEKDKEKRAEYLAQARTTLAEAREKFQQALEKFRDRLRSLPPAPKVTTKTPARDRTDPAAEAREQAIANIREAIFQTALVDYYLAQTFDDPASAERTAAVKKAAKAFNDIYQGNRGNVTGLYAHMWEGKCCDESGDYQQALDIYEEVLAIAPEPGEKGPATGLEPIFTQVEHFRLMILAKQKPKEFLGEAVAWLQYYRRLEQSDGYQGIALEYVKALLDRAEKGPSAEKNKRMAEILQILSRCSRVRSQHQQEFILLKRELLKKRGGDENAEAATFDEAVTLGDDAAGESKWDKALDFYNRAIELAEKVKMKDPARIGAVREAIGRVQYMMALDLFNKGKLSECIESVRKIVLDDDGTVRKDSAAAARASALGVTAALNLYVAVSADQKQGADKKQAALERLIKVAEFTERNWPDRPEADDARIARAQAYLVVGDVPKAIEIFDRVNPRSERYPTAMYMAGQNYWRLYVTEKMKNEKKRDQVRMTSDRGRAIECLSAALEIIRKQVEPNKPLPKYFLEAQLLLAEIRAEGNELKEAAELYQPLVDIVQAEKQESLDATTMRIFLGAVRAYTGLNDVDNAGKVGTKLIELGPDSPQVNGALIEFAMLLNMEKKKADARVTDLDSTTNYGELAEAQKRLKSIQELLGKMLAKLAQRQKMSAAGMVFIGDTLASIDMTAEASEQYQNILKRIETDEEFKKAAKGAVTRVRAQLIGVLRKEGKFDAAVTQVDQLIKDNPNALEPLMEKGRILEAWAEKNPAKFEEAVAHWAKLRQRLQPMKKKPDEYYDVMYNVAACLMREAEKSKEPAVKLDRAKKAEQVLKSPLILSPTLGGRPDTVARYNALIKKAIVMQGRSPDKKVDKKSDGKKP